MLRLVSGIKYSSRSGDALKDLNIYLKDSYIKISATIIQTVRSEHITVFKFASVLKCDACLPVNVSSCPGLGATNAILG